MKYTKIKTTLKLKYTLFNISGYASEFVFTE